MKKRCICPHCNYPQTVCICAFINEVEVPLQITILQHPLESKHGKNTARLLPLCIENSEILIGENEQDFADVKEPVISTFQNTWVLYPNTDSQPLEEHKTHYPNTLPDRLIVIDATWRKATKMWQLNPWLHELPSWHFNTLPQNQYRIRKSKLEHSLSSLEATAHALKLIYNTDTQPLLTLFDAMQKQQEKHTPSHHLNNRFKV
ncbi:MAG: tRNA-uridine aminocarboxypropyltransferase [Aliiglaciecola sp.]|uniref:tRNA-uridine aminocarboxypropyltransferase n=1 Tax=Aliiglaciecola sp. TaxID=1872441 RepID=UPI0032977742